MPTPLLRTKLFVPPVRPGLVPRPRLDARLSPAARPRLTLVSAPPGFGKTTLLSAWVAAETSAERPVAWVSLEEGEQEPGVFWTYVATALEAAAPGVAEAALPLLQTAQPPIATVLATVLNGLGALPQGLVLVLDDYHLADSPAIADDVAFLLEHLPPEVQLVISTRADPALPLARLRARGELVEVRAADLRFTPAEVASYLNEVIGLGLSAADVTALEGRTEGWIAALQLAALSIRGRDDASSFIAGFAGDDRYVVDYLVEEVLVRQPDDVRRFLLETSILDRLCGALCDAVTGGNAGRAELERLERSNLFVVPLDDSRQWYRYHHLFADVLRAHLLEEPHDEVAALHRRASRWYDAEGEPVPAVRHALASGDVAAAADLVEAAVLGFLRDRREVTARSWIDDLPADVVSTRPVLAIGFIGALMSTGEFADVEPRLDEVERLLGSASADPSVVLTAVDPADLARLPGAIEMYRAALALIRGDPAATAAHADLAIATAAAGDHVTVSAAAALAGLAAWGSGDLAGAVRGYSTAVDGLLRAGHYPDVLGCSISVADLELTLGRLGEARRTYVAGLDLAAAEQPEGVMRGTADMLVGLALVELERGDLRSAADHLTRAEDLGEHTGLPQHPTVAGSPAPGCTRRTGTSPPRPSSSRRPSRSTSETSHRTCGRSRRRGLGCWWRRGGRPTLSTGCAGPECPPTTTSPTSASTSTSPWPGSCWPPPVPSTHLRWARRTGCWSGSGWPPRPADGSGAWSRSWPCSRSPTMPATVDTTCPARWTLWSRHCGWPSPRATCTSSSARVPRCGPCSTR